MSWLLNNPVANMPGPRFLLFFALVISVTLVGCWLARRAADPTRELAPPPVPAEPDPYEVAFLRGGENEAMRVAILGLIQRGYLRATQTPEHLAGGAGEERIQQAPRHPDVRHLVPLERSVFDAFAAPREAGEVFQEGELTSRIQAHCLAYERHLRTQRLLMPPEVAQAAGTIGWTGALIVLGLGGYKLAVALWRGRRNVVFLILMGLLALVLLYAVCRTPRLSRRGQAYLDRLRLAFDRLNERAGSLAQAGDPRLLLLVGLFGVGVLAGGPYDYYQRMFHRAAASGSSCGTGCGSCGGGSGGGDGGGGCGGCGGGCGGGD